MMRIGSLFSGILGLDLAVERACPGAALEWACDIEPMPRRLIRARRPAARLFGDVRRLRPPPCDILVGGFPCQDISVAGLQAGLAGAKSGLWGEMRRVIAECRPQRVLVENVRNLRTLGLREVLADLQALGYAAEWQTVQALAAGALHKRSRIFIVAYPDVQGAPLLFHGGLRDDYAAAFRRHRAGFWARFPCSPVIGAGDMPSDVRGARLTATGNAVCPMQAEPLARALAGEGEPFGAPTEMIERAGGKMPFAGAMRRGRIYEREVAIPEALASEWHDAWVQAHPDIARRVLPANRGTYPTPSAADYGSSQNGVNGVGGENERPSAGTSSPSTMARSGELGLWPTACTTDAASAARHTTDPDGAMNPGTTLTDAARLWATPAAANWRSGSVGDECFDRNSRPLQEQALRHFDATATAGRFLNPEWVAWLMGFPAGWFDGTSDADGQLSIWPTR